MNNGCRANKRFTILAIAMILTIVAIIYTQFISIDLWSFMDETEKQGMDGVKTMELRLNYDLTYQTIEGFGASGAWWAQDVGGWNNIDEIMDLLYDSDKGIGLNIYRYNIGAGGPCNIQDVWRRSKTIEISPGTYDLERDKNAINAMKKAVERGAEVVAFANSPPARLTISGKTSGEKDGKSNLRPGAEQDFAEYLVDITELLLDEGIPVKYLSPINEPQWDWHEGQEGCHYEPDQIIEVSRRVALELESRDLPVRISIAESGAWNDDKYTLNLYRRIMDDEVLANAMDHYAVHSYWSSPRDKKIAALYFEKFDDLLPLHQSEWCQMEHGIDMGMDGALTLAREVYEDMTILSVATWQHWIAVSKYDYQDGLVYVDTDSRKYRAAKRMWALGNYSKFIKPGYRRVEVEADSEENVNKNILVTAYVDPDTDETVIVAINTEAEEEKVSFTGLKGKDADVYITSDDYDCELVEEITKFKSYTLPAKSVTSFIVS